MMMKQYGPVIVAALSKGESATRSSSYLGRWCLCLLHGRFIMRVVACAEHIEIEIRETAPRITYVQRFVIGISRIRYISRDTSARIIIKPSADFYRDEYVYSF